uniref:GB1/RHD3-type G domain-containing protein n=1 Tax=Macaca nemestrina TaxID=9545 RepID=A0A2K6D4B9_MACNE
MESGPKMLAPICLVENNNDKLLVNQQAIQILEKISQPVVVVAIVGLYRTGKSYLMNHLAGQNHGFPLGSTVQSETKGIWMWCVPHPSKPNHTLVLLDTEGLGDVEKGDPKNDSWIFALAVLLCSTFVYNSMSTINHQALEQLHYVTELTELIKAKSNPRPDGVEDSTEFVSFFPDFIWTVRDFTLELKLNGDPITEDEYLENALKLIQGKNPKVQTSNLPRECIRHFFPKRKCFVFDRPTHDKDLLANIEKVAEKQLDPKFQEQTNIFCSYIFTHARTKTLREGITVTGNRECHSSVALLCLGYAVDYLARVRLDHAEAADYPAAMASGEASTTRSRVLDVHAGLLFYQILFIPSIVSFLCIFLFPCMNQLIRRGVIVQNEGPLFVCHLINELSKGISAEVSLFLEAKAYMETRTKIEQDLKSQEKGTVKVRHKVRGEVYRIEGNSCVGYKLTDRGEAVDRAKKEAAEKEQELLKQKLQEQQQQMEAQEKSLKENIAQLKEKLQMEREHLLREQNMMLEHKLKVQKDLLDEGFKKKSEEMNAEINQLKHVIDTTKNDDTPWIARTLDKLGDELTSILSAPAKLIGQVVKGVSSLFKKHKLLF